MVQLPFLNFYMRYHFLLFCFVYIRNRFDGFESIEDVLCLLLSLHLLYSLIFPLIFCSFLCVFASLFFVQHLASVE